MQKLFENFTISILKLNKLIHKIKLYEMEEYGLKAVHVMCLYYLSEHSCGLTCTQLINLTYEDKAAISRALRLLACKGYIDYDGAKYNSAVRLTPSGAEIALQVKKKAERAAEAGKDGTLTEQEREAFYSSLEKISGNLKSYYGALTAEKKNHTGER